MTDYFKILMQSLLPRVLVLSNLFKHPFKQPLRHNLLRRINLRHRSRKPLFNLLPRLLLPKCLALRHLLLGRLPKSNSGQFNLLSRDTIHRSKLPSSRDTMHRPRLVYSLETTCNPKALSLRAPRRNLPTHRSPNNPPLSRVPPK